MREVAQSCPSLCDPMDCSPPGSSVHGILQARILEWVAISFSRRTSWPRDRTQVSCIAGWHFTVWATREHSLKSLTKMPKNVLWDHTLIFNELSILSSEDPITSKPLFLSFFVTYVLFHSVVHYLFHQVWLWDPMYCSPPGSSIYGRLQAKRPEWVAVPFSRGSFQPRDWSWVSCIAGRFLTIWAIYILLTLYIAFQVSP